MLLALLAGIAEAGLTVKVDCDDTGGPATNVTVAIKEAPPKLAVMVSTWATVPFSVAVNTPSALVFPVGGLNVYPEPLSEKVTTWPLITLFVLSRAVTVSDAVAVLSATRDDGVSVNVDVLLLGGPSTKVTVAVLLSPANAAVTVSVCGLVLTKVTEHVPNVVVVHVLARRVAPGRCLPGAPTGPYVPN